MGRLFLAFTLIPLLELWLLVRIGQVVGPGSTLLFVVLMGVLGAAAARSQGRKVLADWQRALSEGRVPEEGVLGGMLVLVGGILLITPGVITDLVGLLLLMPWTRKWFAQTVRRNLEQQIARGQVRVYTTSSAPSPRPAKRPRESASRAPTEVGRATYRPGEVIDTDGEEL